MLIPATDETSSFVIVPVPDALVKVVVLPVVSVMPEEV